MTTEVLPLRQAPNTHNNECATRPIADEVLRSFRTMFAHAEAGPEHQDVDTQLANHTAALASADGRSAIIQLTEPIVSVCRAAVAVVARRQELRRHDIASLVTIVRETVESLAAGNAASAAALGESTARLDNLQQVTDFSQLKQLLAAEVVTLRQIANERESENQRTVALLRERLTTAEQQLFRARAEALVDPLTEVANRRGFDSALAERIKTSDPTTPLVLAMFDVDLFKGMNDRFGHPVGDAVLRHIAKSIRESVRQDDVVARIGGDEFALIATGLTLAQAESRLRSILHKISAEPIGTHGVMVSVSCGVSEHSAGDSVQTLIGRTDAALNDAKVLGKNRVVSREAPYIRNLLRRR